MVEHDGLHRSGGSRGNASPDVPASHPTLFGRRPPDDSLGISSFEIPLPTLQDKVLDRPGRATNARQGYGLVFFKRTASPPGGDDLFEFAFEEEELPFVPKAMVTEVWLKAWRGLCIPVAEVEERATVHVVFVEPIFRRIPSTLLSRLGHQRARDL